MIIRSIKNNLRFKLWRLLKINWTLRSGININVQSDSDWFVYNEIFANKEYDRALELFLDSNPTNPLIVDLGANVGYFTIKIADELFQKGINEFELISVEGSPSNFDILRRRTKQKKLTGKVKCFLGLAGFKSGTEMVKYSDQHYGHSIKSDIQNNSIRSVNVNYINIETLLPDGNMEIDFLKCDIEGSEEIFIREYFSLLQRVKHAVFEFHAGECNVNECKRMLLAAGLTSRGMISGQLKYQTTVEFFSRS